MRNSTRYQTIAVIVCILTVVPLPSISARNTSNAVTGGESSPLSLSLDDPSADVGVSKSASPDEVAPGSDITYEITVTNGGPDPADNASLSDMLPPTLTFVSISAPAGWTCMTPAVGAGGSVSCTNPSFDPTSGDVFTLVVNVPADAVPGTFFTNTATVSTTTFDPNDENNSSSTSTLVSGLMTADVIVSKSASAAEVPAGFALTYTIEVANGGPDSANNVTLDDPLPASVNFVSLAAPAGWTCMTPAPGFGGTVSCSRPTFVAGGDDTFTVAVFVRADTPPDTIVVNTATVGTSSSESSTENNSDTAFFTVVAADPTAGNGMVSGTILDGRGSPVSGAVIELSGAQLRKTITDANGNYRFDNVETGGFYTVTPSRANFNFNPFNRSFSQTGNQTESLFTAASPGDNTNPLDTAEYFVRQQYLDILGREPDESGFNYWSDQILACGTDPNCSRAQRTGVAAAFFIENEGQQTGLYIYDLYTAALGRRPVFSEYKVDRGQVVGGDNLDAAKMAFAWNFVQRAEFVAKYQNAMTAETFVDALFQSVQLSGADLSAERANLIGIYGRGSDLANSRALVLGTLADNARFKQSQYNQAFVLTEYFSYLKRDIDQRGYNFWVQSLSAGDPGNYRGMVCAFVTSAEYQQRFSTVVSRSNSECSGH